MFVHHTWPFSKYHAHYGFGLLGMSVHAKYSEIKPHGKCDI